MAVPFPWSLERTLDSDVSHHPGLQDGELKGNGRSKNIIPGKVNGLQERKQKMDGAWVTFRASVNRSQYFSSLGHFIFLLNVCSIP